MGFVTTTFISCQSFTICENELLLVHVNIEKQHTGKDKTINFKTEKLHRQNNLNFSILIEDARFRCVCVDVRVWMCVCGW